MGVIYKITSPSGKIYIGKTKNLHNRIKSYKMSTLKPTTLMHKSIIKYGWDSHTVSVVEEVCESMLNIREIFWINELKTNRSVYPKGNGMNLTIGGDCGSLVWMNDEAKRAGAIEKRSGKNNWNYGKKVPKEIREKIAASVSIANKKNGTKVPDWARNIANERNKKPLVCYDINGDFIAKFRSSTEASVALNIPKKDLKAVARGVQTNARNVIAKYIYGETYPLKIDVSNIKHNTPPRPIVCLNKKGEIVKEYASAKYVAEDLGVSRRAVTVQAHKNTRHSNPLNKRANKRTEYIFIYKDLYYSQLN